MVEAATATDVLVFDWWVRNEDRHLTEMSGNPNLLWDMQAGQLAGVRELLVRAKVGALFQREKIGSEDFAVLPLRPHG